MYWAHSDSSGRSKNDPRGRWQGLHPHLLAVARLAERFAQAARPDDETWRHQAFLAGALHDLGKYTDAFQRRLDGSREKAPHAIHGAALAYRRFASAETAFVIAGHHAGIPDRSDLQSKVHKQEQTGDLTGLWSRALSDFPLLADLSPLPHAVSLGMDMRIRMLLSCLVDADRLDTEASAAGRTVCYEPHEADAGQLLSALYRAIDSRVANVPDGVVKQARREVLEHCIAAAEWPESILSLTVPTGGAKTLASLAFALERVKRKMAHRVIVVIPYLSIIEQNAQVFRDALGDDVILEHHSGHFERLRPSKQDRDVLVHEEVCEGDDVPGTRQPTENWNVPVIVTTSVRFFESILSNRPSDLRRLHHVARSVVILDEVQTLPRHFLCPLLSVVKELSENWGVTFVSCSATQPAFMKPPNALPGDARWQAGTMREIIREPAHLFQRLQRVTVEWPGPEATPWRQVAAGMAAAGQALCIVNTREQAATLYREVRGINAEGAIHLSTRQCAAHRLVILAEIRRRMNVGEPCLVCSTQLVEAGVDLDFPLVYRALGPLDSIIQAAGRCDREGKLTAEAGRPAGRLIVFRTEDAKTPPNAYKEATGTTETMLGEGRLDCIDDPAVLREFFNRHYGNEADLGSALEKDRQALKFRTVADEFEMIADLTRDIFVSYDQKARDSLERLRAIGQMTAELRLDLQRYVVGLRAHEFREATVALHEVRKGSDLWICIDGFYDEDLGFVLKRSSGEFVV